MNSLKEKIDRLSSSREGVKKMTPADNDHIGAVHIRGGEAVSLSTEQHIESLYVPRTNKSSNQRQTNRHKGPAPGNSEALPATYQENNHSNQTLPTQTPFRNHRRRRSSFSLGDLYATTLFVDLEGYSQKTNLTQRHVSSAFMTTLSNLLTFCYGPLPSRQNVDDYVILPTGDGAAVVVIRPPLRRVLNDENCDRDECGDDDDDYKRPNGSAANGSCSADRLSLSSIASSETGKLFGLNCSSCSQISLQTTEETALWLGSSLLLWSESIQIGLRVGLYSGELSIMEDPYGDPNVCGDAINMAARIMDTALPGQILASADTVVTRLIYMQQRNDNLCVCSKCPNMRFDMASQPSEVVVKHGITTYVQSITVELYPLPQESIADAEDGRRGETVASDEFGHLEQHHRRKSTSDLIQVHPLVEIKTNTRKQSFANLSSLQPAGNSEAVTPLSTQTSTSQVPYRIGNHKTPVTKWYMKIKPTEMKASDGRIKPKVPPQELIRRHHKIAFIGIMHDNLSNAFIKILEEEPHHRWDQVIVLFPSDECMRNTMEVNYSIQPVEKLIENKNLCRSSLYELLSPVVRDLKFLQYNQLMHCGSYWDWRDPGGFIHVSPVTWGANPKTCPAMNYYWNSKMPSPEYRVYREGLEYLLKVATPF